MRKVQLDPRSGKSIDVARTFTTYQAKILEVVSLIWKNSKSPEIETVQRSPYQGKQ